MSRPSTNIATTDSVGSVLPQQSTVWRDKGCGASWANSAVDFTGAPSTCHEGEGLRCSIPAG